MSEKEQTELQRNRATHAVSLYLGFDQTSTYRKSSDSLSVPPLRNCENSKAHLPVAYPNTQEPLTTMIYTHTVKSVTLKEVKSPLDF
jgi:hypothetical protein